MQTTQPQSLISFLLVQPYLRDDLKNKNPQAPYVLFSNLQHFVLRLGGKALLVSMLLLVADIPM